jgi:D-alanyl-D-alanine carboxypeptidase
MPIFSVTKTFTAAEVMHLVELGKVRLRAKVSSYITLPFRDNGATIRDLLSMRSGIPDYVDPLIEHYSSRPHGVDTRVSGAQISALIPKQVGVANYDFEYSSTNYLLLTRVIEKATGATYARALRRDLLTPARLDRVFVQDAERPTPPLARAAPPIAGTGPYLPNTLIASGGSGAGCIAADAQSIARWGYALFDETLLRPATIAAMLPTQFENYGLGVEPANQGDLTLYGHSGAAPGGRTGLWVDRTDKISVAVLMATDNPDSDPVPVADALIEELRPGGSAR